MPIKEPALWLRNQAAPQHPQEVRCRDRGGKKVPHLRCASVPVALGKALGSKRFDFASGLPRPMDRTSQTPTFVVGTGRCGSTLLSHMLADHGDVLSLSEFFTTIGSDRAFSRDYMDGAELWQLLSVPSAEAARILQAETIPEVRLPQSLALRQWKDVPPLLLITLPGLTSCPQDLFDEFETAVCVLPTMSSAAIYQWTFDWLRDRLQKRLWVERSGGSLQFVEHLLARWPIARVIHLWRDGPSCALSMHGHPYFRAMVARLRANRTPLAQLTAATFGSYWSASMIHGLSVLGNLDPARVLHISFSALTKAPRAVLERVAAFIGVDARQRWLEHAESRVRPMASRVDALDVEVRRALERACRPGARAVRDAGLSE
jgi:hypothetical protein